MTEKTKSTVGADFIKGNCAISFDTGNLIKSNMYFDFSFFFFTLSGKTVKPEGLNTNPKQLNYIIKARLLRKLLSYPYALSSFSVKGRLVILT